MKVLTIATGSVVCITYDVKTDQGKLVDRSGEHPLEAVVGAGQLVEELEQALLGRCRGDTFTLAISPQAGFGVRDASRILVAHRRDLPQHFQPEVGLELAYPGDQGESLSMWVTAMHGEQITLDGNHPLAGCTLHLSVEIRDVKETTSSTHPPSAGAIAAEIDDDFETGHTTH